MDAPEESRRRRLDALNRKPLVRGDKPSELDELRRRVRKIREHKAADVASGQTSVSVPGLALPGRLQPIVFRRDLPATRRTKSPSPTTPIGPHIELDQAVVGEDLTTPQGRRAFVVRRSVMDNPGDAAALCQSLAGALTDRSSGLWAQMHLAGIEANLQPEDLILFDLETTGLSSSPLFLIGAMVFQNGALVSHQFFARDYSQEAGVLEMFLSLAAGRKLLVSFNGKSFDAPFVLTRAAANGVLCRLAHDHLDLLHAARRAWGGRLPDCRLQTLECYVCSRTRTDDIPGHLIPDAYHDFVRTGNACQIVDVLEHNFLDLLTLADIMTRFPRSAGN